jgi:hypothetical protein
MSATHGFESNTLETCWSGLLEGLVGNGSSNIVCGAVHFPKPSHFPPANSLSPAKRSHGYVYVSVSGMWSDLVSFMFLACKRVSCDLRLLVVASFNLFACLLVCLFVWVCLRLLV